jgi:hypothetical protein
MRFLLTVPALILAVCTTASAQQFFGEKITGENAVVSAELPALLDAEGSKNLKVRGEVTGVCQAKGCWMTVSVGNNEEVMVRFKDYGFFVPKNITGQTVVFEGEAKMETVSVEDQRHLARDAGKPEDEVKKITDPSRQLSFTANGVIVEE